MEYIKIITESPARPRAALLEGPPGCGKTYLATQLSRELGCPLIYSLLHSWSDDQELFSGNDVAAAVAGDAASVRQPGVLAVAAEASRRGVAVLCLDEVDKCQERTEYLLLDFLQSGRVPVRPGHHLQADLERLIVIMTSNATRPLSDALLRRVRRIRMPAMSVETMTDIVSTETSADRGLVKLVCKAAVEVCAADGQHLSVQELRNLVVDLLAFADTIDDIRELLGQWAARGDAGAELARKYGCAPILGQLRVVRRTTHE
ncbi:MAG: AAA family ATPase [Nitrososphaerota archaeon]